jgi:uncharacterized protein (DUF58 family)
MVLLDVSASMGFGSGPVRKIDYAKFLGASIVYLAHLQRDGTGLITFADDVTNFIRPSSRQGQLVRLIHGLDSATLGKRTDFAKPFFELQRVMRQRGLTVIISDFYDDPQTVIKTVEPLRYRGNELVLFHVLDAHEVEPALDGPALLLDMETEEAIETTGEYARTEYRGKIAAHIEAMRSKAQAAGLGYFLLRTDRPLDAALREYFRMREGKL